MGTEAKKDGLDIDITTLDELKKLIKKWAKKYDILIVSDTVIKKVPVVCGPVLNRIQKFPVTVSHNQPLILSVQDLRASVKFQLRKVTCMGCCAGREDMTDDELRQNIMM